MRKILSAVLTTAATATVLAGGAVSASAATAADGWGCPSGDVCLIGLTSGTIENEYYTYGAHNLSGKYGDYFVDNNQTGGATVTLCYGYSGAKCTGDTVPAGTTYVENLTPINSVRLNRP